MAFEVDAARLNPAILRALTECPRDLTAAELTKLGAELDKDPKKLGYREDAQPETPKPEEAPLEVSQVEGEAQVAEAAPEPPAATGAPSLKSPQALAALLNSSGRAGELFGAMIVEAADIMRATS